MFTAAQANQPGFNMAMQQQMMMMMHMQMMMSGNNVGSSSTGTAAAAAAAAAVAGAAPPGIKGQSRDAPLGALPPAPPGGEDPRARKGRLSYRDLDEPSGAGDGGLPY
jgi:hypothetical protein